MGPDDGRGVVGIVPPLTQSSGTKMLSNIMANASVASARKMPPSRKRGMASRAPTAAAITAPTTIVVSTGMSNRSASCAVANAPMPANDAWHSEIWPAIPVITVIDRKIRAKITPA